MATTLRELIAKVVFRADPSQLENFDAKLDAAKATLTGLQAQASKGLEFAIGGSGGARLLDLEANLEATTAAAEETAQGLAGVGDAAKKAKPPTQGFGALLDDLKKGLGAAAAAAVAYKALGFGMSLVAEARQVGEFAGQLGIGTDELQTWTAFATRAGASNEDFGATVKALANNMRAAAEAADGPAAEGFKKLGISTQGWAGKLPNTMDVLVAAGGALSDLEGSTERLALAQQLLGEAGLKLLPGFEGGADAAKEQLEQLRDLAVVYDKDFIESSKTATEEMDLFERQMKGVGVEVLLGVLPALRDLVRWLTPVVKGLRNAVRDSNALTAALGVAGGAGVLKLVANMSKLVNVLKLGGRLLLRFVLPFLVLDDIISFLKGEGSVIGDVLDAMFGAGAAQAVLDGIRDAWHGISGAASSLWNTLGLVIDRTFETGEAGKMSAEEFEGAFLRASEGIGKAFDALFEGIGNVQSDWFEAWKFAWGDLADWYTDIWAGVIDWLGEMLSASVEKVKGFVSDLPLIGRLFEGNANAQNALALGGSPAATGSQSTSVTVNDHSTITSNLNGVDAQNVGPALRQTERNIQTELKRNKAQVLRQTVGAAGA